MASASEGVGLPACAKMGLLVVLVGPDLRRGGEQVARRAGKEARGEEQSLHQCAVGIVYMVVQKQNRLSLSS